MINLRKKQRDPVARSKDFDWIMSETPNNRHPECRKWKKYKSKLLEFDFGIVYWGSIGEIRDVDPTASSTVIYIKDKTPDKSVRSVMEKIDWKSLPCDFVGAPHLSPYQIVDAYEEFAKE
jgi:hypothetical protein